MAAPVISFHQVTKRFQPQSLMSAVIGGWASEARPRPAVDEVEFSIERGEAVALVGPTGAGKSTILKLIAGAISPEVGNVRVNGRVVSLIEWGAGPLPLGTGRECILLIGLALGLSKTEVQAKFEKIHEFAELQKQIDDPVSQYATGLYLRLVLSVVFHSRPEILLLDEVLSKFDARFQEKCLSAIQALIKEQHTTVILVSHDEEHLDRICERALLLHQGQVLDDGPVAEVMFQYRGLQAGADSLAEQRKLPSHSHRRWGSFAAKIEYLDFLHRSPVPPVFEDTDEHITLQLRVRAKSIIKTVHLGLEVKRGDGEVVYQYSTVYEAAPLTNWHADEKRVFEISVPNIFAKGKYTIGVTLHGPKPEEVYDQWERALRFRVHRLAVAGSPVVVPFAVKKIATP